MNSLVPIKRICRENPALGATGRTVRKNCALHGVDVVKINDRNFALTAENYEKLLTKLTETA
jgi:hypothetical protein